MDIKKMSPAKYDKWSQRYYAETGRDALQDHRVFCYYCGDLQHPRFGDLVVVNKNFYRREK